MLEHAPDRSTRSALRWAAPALIAVAVLIPVRLAARSPHDRDSAAVSSSADAYVLFLDATSVTMSGTMDDLAQARKLRDGRDGPTLWFRRGGKEFLVTDPATLRSIADTQRPEHERATEARQAQVAAEQTELEARLEALSRGRDEASEQTLKRALAADERRAGEASQLRAQAEMERELAAVSSRVDRLNSEQDVIAKEIERAAMEADRRIRILLEKRIESGAARHVGPEGGVEGGVKGGVKGGVEGGIEGGVDNGDDGGTDGSVEL
jgi:hypothetical protein